MGLDPTHSLTMTYAEQGYSTYAVALFGMLSPNDSPEHLCSPSVPSCGSSYLPTIPDPILTNLSDSILTILSGPKLILAVDQKIPLEETYICLVFHNIIIIVQNNLFPNILTERKQNVNKTERRRNASGRLGRVPGKCRTRH